MPSDEQRARAQKRREQPWLVGVAVSSEQVREADLRFWQSLPAARRFEAVCELASDAMAMKGRIDGVEPRLQRSIGGVRCASVYLQSSRANGTHPTS